MTHAMSLMGHQSRLMGGGSTSTSTNNMSISINADIGTGSTVRYQHHLMYI